MGCGAARRGPEGAPLRRVKRLCYNNSVTNNASPTQLPKLNLSSREVQQMLGSPRLFRRLVFHRWLLPLYPSRDLLFPLSRVLLVQRRLEAGECPPLLPCEVRQRARARAA